MYSYIWHTKEYHSSLQTFNHARFCKKNVLWPPFALIRNLFVWLAFAPIRPSIDSHGNVLLVSFTGNFAVVCLANAQRGLGKYTFSGLSIQSDRSGAEWLPIVKQLNGCFHWKPPLHHNFAQPLVWLLTELVKTCNTQMPFNQKNFFRSFLLILQSFYVCLLVFSLMLLGVFFS